MYEKLIESSRACASGYNGNCDRCLFCGMSNDKDGDCYQQLHKAAANAIESLLEISKRYYDLLEKMPRWMPFPEPPEE